MATTIPQIDALLTVRSEDEHLEFKEAANNFHFEELVDYCVALANEGGGRMLLGITDKMPRRVAGTKAFEVPERKLAGIYERLHLKVTFDEVAHPSGRVLVFLVPSRPVGQPVHFKDRYLIRAGEELVPMTPDQLKKIMAEGEPDWALKTAMTECDGEKVVQVLDTQSFFDLLHLPYPATREAVLERFASERLIEQALRREVKMFPEIAVRELVANALIHQDFTESGTSVMVEIYDDRMEISNPGKPFISPDRFIDEYQSRNERLADLMRRLGICEEKGSGVDKVIQAAEAFQLPAPDFRVGEKRTSVLLYGHKDFEDMDRNDRIRATYQHSCLRYVMNEKMTNQSLRERFRLSEKKTESVSRAIRDAVDAGKIKLADPEQTSLRYRDYVPFWA